MTGMWTEQVVGGHPCHCYAPPEVNEHGFVVLYLHGVRMGQLHDKQPFLDSLDRHGLPVVAPVTRRSWWTDRICPEFDAKLTAERHLLDNVLPLIEHQYAARPPAIGLLGTSMGGQGALRLAYKHPSVFPVVAAISPAIDYHTRWDDGDETLPMMYRDKEHVRQDTATLHVNPLNYPRHQFFCCDPTDYRWLDSSERLQMKLYSLGVPHQCHFETEAGGHGFDYYNAMAETAISFLAEKLEAERLRVV